MIVEEAEEGIDLSDLNWSTACLEVRVGVLQWARANGWVLAMNLCSNCGQHLSVDPDHPVHLSGEYRGKHRCDPNDTGQPYGLEATHPKV